MNITEKHPPTKHTLTINTPENHTPNKHPPHTTLHSLWLHDRHPPAPRACMEHTPNKHTHTTLTLAARPPPSCIWSTHPTNTHPHTHYTHSGCTTATLLLVEPCPARRPQLVAVALAPAHGEEVVGAHGLHVGGHDAGGGVEVDPHEVGHQLGDGGRADLVRGLRVHALQLHAALKLVVFIVLGGE